MSMKRCDSSRVAARWLRGTAVFPLYDMARAGIKKGLELAEKNSNSVLDKLKKAFSRYELELDPRYSAIYWEIHGSDGLRVTYELSFRELRTEEIRSKDVIESILHEDFDIWGTLWRKEDRWIVEGGDG